MLCKQFNWENVDSVMGYAAGLLRDIEEARAGYRHHPARELDSTMGRDLAALGAVCETMQLLGLSHGQDEFIQEVRQFTKRGGQNDWA